jgi:type III secretion system needle length determinant
MKISNVPPKNKLSAAEDAEAEGKVSKVSSGKEDENVEDMAHQFSALMETPAKPPQHPKGTSKKGIKRVPESTSFLGKSGELKGESPDGTEADPTEGQDKVGNRESRTEGMSSPLGEEPGKGKGKLTQETPSAYQASKGGLKEPLSQTRRGLPPEREGITKGEKPMEGSPVPRETSSSDLTDSGKEDLIESKGKKGPQEATEPPKEFAVRSDLEKLTSFSLNLPGESTQVETKAGFSPPPEIPEEIQTIVDQILVTDSQFSEKEEVRIILKDTFLAGTEIHITKENEGVRVVLATTSNESHVFLLEQKGNLETHLRDKLGEGIQVELQFGESGQEEGQGRSRQRRSIFEEWQENSE